MTIALQLHREAKSSGSGKGNVSLQDIELHRRLLQVTRNSGANPTTRVTRLGEFSPIGRLFSLGSSSKNCRSSQIFWATIFCGKNYLLALTTTGLGYILGYFFKNASGHPAHGFWGRFLNRVQAENFASSNLEVNKFIPIKFATCKFSTCKFSTWTWFKNRPLNLQRCSM
jgi:hypothetical protein